ncbi:MAG TPA: Fur family transcriptional regulator [Thermomonospora sp.]|nr:Fur family transcriptional regulator [Thermomonospora sp.]
MASPGPAPPGSARRHGWALARLRAAGYRSTRPRVLLLRVLADADGHLTADALHRRATASRHLDLSTVYRTLAVFERIRLVHTLEIGGRVTYGLADHPHAHAVCTGCARVAALRGGPWERLTAQVAARWEGFVCDGVVIRGQCGRCLAGGTDTADE